MKHRISNMNSECLTHHRKNCPAHIFSLCAPARSPIRCDSLHNKENGVVRCTAIINNLFSVEVHIGADACWVVSFGKMALICSGPHTASAPPKDASSKALWSNVVCITPWTLNSQVWKIPVNVIVLWSHYYNLINHINIKKMLKHQVFALVFKCIASQAFCCRLHFGSVEKRLRHFPRKAHLFYASECFDIKKLWRP